MPTTDTGATKARDVFAENGGMLRTSKALRLCIHPRTLYARIFVALRSLGLLIRTRHGRGQSTTFQLTNAHVVQSGYPTARKLKLCRG